MFKSSDNELLYTFTESRRFELAIPRGFNNRVVIPKRKKKQITRINKYIIIATSHTPFRKQNIDMFWNYNRLCREFHRV